MVHSRKRYIYFKGSKMLSALDNNFQWFQKSKPASKKTKKANLSESDSDCFIPDSDSHKSSPVAKGRIVSGRAKKPTKYAHSFTDDDDDDSF